MQNYKLLLTKESLINSKFDVRTWTNEMKTLFQETLFEMGIVWEGYCTPTVQKLRAEQYYVNAVHIMYTNDSEFFEADSYDELTFDEMFSLVMQEPLSEDFPSPEYTYTKCTFTKASAALRAFEEGEELYRKINDFVYSVIENDINLCVSYVEDTIYRKVSTPWYETVSSEKPIYVKREASLYKVNRFKEGMLISINGVYLSPKDCTPLTRTEVDDMLATMKLWEK